VGGRSFDRTNPDGVTGAALADIPAGTGAGGVGGDGNPSNNLGNGINIGVGGGGAPALSPLGTAALVGVLGIVGAIVVGRRKPPRGP